MINYIKYKFFERKMLREIENSSAANMMYALGATQGMFENLIEKHALNLSIDTMQAIDLARNVAKYYEKTDVQTLAMLYTAFLWHFAYDHGKTLHLNEKEDEDRGLRIKYGLENFNVTEKSGYLFLAPIHQQNYRDFLSKNKGTKNVHVKQSSKVRSHVKWPLFFLAGIFLVTVSLLVIINVSDGVGTESLMWPDEYVIEAFQLGGHGVRESQLTAYLNSEHGYLNPVEEYATNFFNNGGDVMWIVCADGYEVTECTSDGQSTWEHGDGMCGVLFDDLPKTRTEVICKKSL